MLKITIIIFLISVIILLIGTWKNINLLKIIGLTLLLIVNSLNVVRGLKKWNQSK